MKSIFLLLLLFSPLLSNAQLDCAKFKNGQFTYPDNASFVSVRKGAKQKSYTDGLLVAIWKVKWIDECTLELTCTKLKNGQKNFVKGDIVRAQILNINDNCIQIRIDATRKDVKILEGQISTMCLE